MNLIIKKNIIIKSEKDFLADIYYKNSSSKLPLLIFVHGYKGYKDWGAWDLMAKKFANNGFLFVKFNFAYNGTTINHPTKFDDLEAFGQNNYSKELDQLEEVINLFKTNELVDSDKIILLGHSRGGGICILKAAENKDVTHLVTLASVSNLNRFPMNQELEKWERDGVYYVENARTKQSMPHYYQFYNDFKINESKYDIETKSKFLSIPTLIIHGDSDDSVEVMHAKNLHQWIPNSRLEIIENANHTFAAKEPWDSSILPIELDLAVNKIIEFIN